LTVTGARGEELSLVLQDEDGQNFAFRPLRLLRDGVDLFLLAEREGHGTLHVLKREGDLLGLVRDRETLRRVALRLEILRRAMEGELIQRGGENEQTQNEQTLGVIHRGEVDGRSYLLAADLADPAEVLAFEVKRSGLAAADDRFLALVREQILDPTLEIEAARPGLEAMAVGRRGESIQVTDTAGQTRGYQTAGRFFFEGRDLLFLRRPDDQGATFAVSVREGGRIEALTDEALLGRLKAHLEGGAP